MKNIAIIGASYLQLPLIKKAKEMGLCTHVFAWAANDVGEKEADYFYPISIVEKDRILHKCREIGIDGICSIASDLASITVNYVAQNMGLISNTISCSMKSTNKHLMRECFFDNNDPSPKSIMIEDASDLDEVSLEYPIIVKPIDRSGSRGISLVQNQEQLDEAIENAKKEGFEKKVLIEEFARGQEYSVEGLSWEGKHTILEITKKYTTGAPGFIETGHLEPAQISNELRASIIEVVSHALDSLEIKYGASHSEIKIDENNNIKIIEIGGRMGGDFIGSDLVYLTTGFDFVKAVIEISLGIQPTICLNKKRKPSSVKFIFNKKDVALFEKVDRNDKIRVIQSEIDYARLNETISDSSNRHGYFIMASDDISLLDEALSLK